MNSAAEPGFVRIIRKNKEEIAAQLHPFLEAGHIFETLAAWVSDGTDRLGAIFVETHPNCTEPMVVVFTVDDAKLFANAVQPGLGAQFADPVPRGCINVLTCAEGVARVVLLRCLPADTPSS